jgi:plasmid stabilization system protein ParE
VSLPVSLRARAEADLTDAFAWYEERLPGLGTAFLRSVDGCFARIQRHPEAYPEVHPRVHRTPIHRFPYGVFYVIREDRIDVLAVYHARRRPRGFER